MPRFAALVFFLALLAAPAFAQLESLQPTNAPYFARLADWPTPTTVRSATGAPGPDYWQQRADYTIRVALDPATHTMTGQQRIDYANNSPEHLTHLWVHLEQNLFSPASRGAAITPAGTRFGGAFDSGGYTLERMELIGDGLRGSAQYLVDDTRMRIDLPAPLAPGARLAIELDWSFVIPDYGADRMGRLDVERGAIYQLAQWFPRMVVFDDVRGWNALPYLGQGEFYLNYGDYDVQITLPSEYVVVATGTQTNEEETFGRRELERLAAARRSAERVFIIEPDEAGTRPTGAATTWRFHAENVRDFAWAASNQFILDGASYTTSEGNDVLIMSAYPREGISRNPQNPGWEEATGYGRHAIAYHSDRWYPYPYPVAINVAGIVGGMEYPMIQFSGVDRRHMDLYGVIDHELGHQWFPMIVGSDERRHFWLDEGLASFITALSGRAYYDDNPDPTIPGYGDGDELRVVHLTSPEAVAAFMLEAIHRDLPTVTPSDHIRRPALGFVSYRKPAAGLMILRDHILGPERFDQAFRSYIERWAYKHPQPADFFRTIEDVSGEDLAYFWRGWFYTTDTVDQAVQAIDPAGDVTVVTVRQQGLFLPVDLEVRFADGDVQRQRVPAEAFIHGDSFGVVIRDGRRVLSATVDPDRILPDVDRTNDSLGAR
jgi:hypothetical protein